MVVAAVLCDVVFTADPPELPPSGVADADLSDAAVESSLAPSEAMSEQNLNAARVLVLSSAIAARRRGRVARNRQRLQMQGLCAAALVWLCRPPTDLIAAIQDVQASYLPRAPRTFIERTPEQWRTSTIFSYLYHGSAAVFRQNFRLTRPIFNTLVRLVAPRMRTTRTTPIQPNRVNQQSAAMRRHAPPEFRVAAVLYWLAQGGHIKPVADAAGSGFSTLRRWHGQFVTAVIEFVRPIYMPEEPPSQAAIRLVRETFGARRGISEICMAVDGSHIAFEPREAHTAIEYRNYKGWHSILAVAFVNSFHLFVDINVGHAGRSGDNTVLRSWEFMERLLAHPDVWLGPGGMVAADGGVSDADNVFLNPYHTPETQREVWFNFCHSSTRFFVEEVFGRWKNRWRCLMHPCGLSHKETTRQIFACAVLHNMVTIELRGAGRDEEAFSGTDEAWQRHFRECAPELCPRCAFDGRVVCTHMTRNRYAGTADSPSEEAAQLREHRRRLETPSERREEIADRMLRFLDEDTIGRAATGPGGHDDGRPGCSRDFE